MLTYYFGSIGSGKTTLATSIAQCELERIKCGDSKFKHVLTNFECVGTDKIDFSDIGKVYLEDCLILLDEMQIFADSRDFKTFPKYTTEFLALSRHYNCDICFFSQSWGDSDKKIRSLCNRLYYIKRGYILPYVRFYRIYKEVIVDELTHDIVDGYRFANLKEILLFALNPFRFLPFVKRHGKLKGRIYAPKYYKYFDSYSRPLILSDFQYTKWN